MKGMNNKNGRREGSEQHGAHFLVNFVQEYIMENGVEPKIKDMPVVRRTVEYYFGSFAELLRRANLGEPQLAKRRSRKKRYCRQCKKLLPITNWFFCPGTDCVEKFAEEYNQIFSDEEVEEMRKNNPPVAHFTNGNPVGKTKVITQCKDCPEKCKVKIPEDRDEEQMEVKCRKDFGVVIQTDWIPTGES